MEDLIGRHWHHLPEEEVVDLLGGDVRRGLDLFEVERRRRHFGPNVLTPPRRTSPIVRFLLQFHNSLVYILLGAAVITGVLKDWADVPRSSSASSSSTPSSASSRRPKPRCPSTPWPAR
ncbi:MAG: hypothetical protein GX465_02695 [Acidobacteria bacterium]|nr:hypothetical protein [Acidobacteriota bacterium]